MKKIGIIGLGIMGHGMAVNFLKNGYELAVWNRTPSKANALVAEGAKLLSTPGEVTAFADIIFDVVSDDEASRGIWFGADGILQSAHPEKTLITSATLSLDYTEELIKATRERQLRFLDMPLTGSRAGAETGNLKLLVGGDTGVLDSIRPELAAISQKIYYFGKAGNGMRFKLILNMLMAIHSIAAAQAAALSVSTGLDPKTVKDAIMDGMAPASPFTGLLFDTLEKPQEQTRFAIGMLEKDLRYGLKMAEKYGFDFDLFKDAQKSFAEAKNKGLSEQDWSKILDLYKKSGGS